MKKIATLVCTIFIVCQFTFCQKTTNQDTHSYQIFPTEEEINIDGKLDEVVWEKLESVGKFWYSFPIDD